MNQNNGYGKGLFIGSLAGGLIGSLTALLFTTRSGKEMRKDIKNKTDKYLDDTEKLINDTKAKAEDTINEGKKIFMDSKGEVDSIVSTGKELVDDEINHIKSSINAGVSAYIENKIHNSDHE
jgi:gas vesicle protein